MLLFLSVFFSFISIFIIAWLLIVPVSERRQVGRSLEQLSAWDTREDFPEDAGDQEGSQILPFGERVTQPLLNRSLKFAKKVTPYGMVENIKKNLILAGNPRGMNVDKFLTLKTASACLVFGVIVLMFFIPLFSRSRLITTGVFAVPFGFFIPDLWLRGRLNTRQKTIRKSLPDTIDVLSISVEAGLGFDSALMKIIKNSRGPLAEEFSRMLSETQAGVSRKDAFKSLSQRTNVAELQNFITSMIQADTFGISITKVLRTQAREMRLKRRQKAEEVANKAPVKIIFPLILCILPALLVVIVGPAAIRIYGTLFSLFRG